MTITGLPPVGPESASLANPAYLELLREHFALYTSENPDDYRTRAQIAAEVDQAVMRALTEGCADIPTIVGTIAVAGETAEN